MSDEKDKLTIGKKLHDARVAKGYTLDDLQKNTKIQKRYLIAIEDNDFDALPGEFYVRAFVKQYADSVGLDGSELLSQFDTKLPDTEDPEYVDRVNSDNPETRSAQRKVDQRNEKIRRYIPIVSVSVVVLVILIAIWVAAAHSTRNTDKTQIETSKVSVSSNQKSSTKTSSSSAKKAKKTKKPTKKIAFAKLTESGSNVTYRVSGAPKKTAIKIATTGSGSAWSSVSANGTTLWQAALAGGKSHTVSLPSSVTTATVNTGNAPQTVIYVAGKKLKLTDPTDGSSNQVRVITLQFGKASATSSATNSSTTTGASTTTGTTSSNTTGTTGTQGATGTTGTTSNSSNTTGATGNTDTTGGTTNNSY